MNNFLTTLQSLSTFWETWVCVALLAAMGIASVVHRLRCPYINGKKIASYDEARTAIDSPIFAGPRSLGLMLAGIAMSIAGLYMLYGAISPGIGFSLIIVGLVIMQTEPIRLRIREAEHRVVTSCAYDEEARIAATETLKGRSDWLTMVYFIMLAGVVAGLLAF
ncbi:MAG: hypothetical protein AAGE80_06125 [Pseudomonadota bacterium]